MPRDGSFALSDVRSTTLSLVCEPCGWRGRYVVAKRIDEHGDAKLTDLLPTLAGLSKAALRQHPRPMLGGLRGA
jgi:hypothetical protein